MARGDKEKDSSGEPALVFRILKGTFISLATAAVGCAALYGISVLHENMRVAPTYQMSAESLRLVKGPAWMTPSILAELDVGLLDPDFPQRFSLLDADVAFRIAAAYEKCVWVDRVERIEKHDPRVDPRRPPLEVYLKFRRPLAFIQTRDGFCLVDDKAVRLPGVYREPKLGALKLLVIAGVTSGPPAIGHAWPDDAVVAGVRVADAVDTKREAFGLTAVDVANFGGRRDPRDTEIALFTANETRIKWGKAPSPQADLLQEKSPDEKVAYLDFVYRRMNGQVDGVLSYIDIPNEAIRRRAAESVTRVRS